MRRAAALHTSLERLLSTLRLWIMSTSVLQRAHKYVAQSYVELEQLDASSHASLASIPASGSGHSLVQVRARVEVRARARVRRPGARTASPRCAARSRSGRARRRAAQTARRAR